MAARQELRPERFIPGTDAEHQQVRDLERLYASLRSPAPVEACHGLEGVELADRLLKKGGHIGMLFGSTAIDFWKEAITPEQLATCKDVDVLVFPAMNGDSQPIQPGDDGVDLWVPQTAEFKPQRPVTWWQNVHGAKLGFVITPTVDLKEPGLYIPTPQLLTVMADRELITQADAAGHYDHGAIEIFADSLHKIINPRDVPHFGLLPLATALRYRQTLDEQALGKPGVIDCSVEAFDPELNAFIANHS